MPKDAEHVFFRCPRFEEDRQELEEVIGAKTETETLVRLMLETGRNWTSASSFARKVMTELREEEQKRRKAGKLRPQQFSPAKREYSA